MPTPTQIPYPELNSAALMLGRRLAGTGRLGSGALHDPSTPQLPTFMELMTPTLMNVQNRGTRGRLLAAMETNSRGYDEAHFAGEMPSPLNFGGTRFMTRNNLDLPVPVHNSSYAEAITPGLPILYHGVHSMATGRLSEFAQSPAFEPLSAMMRSMKTHR